ncbi:MAG TPA: hypothetical protein VE690_16795 [Rhodopila sp.]|nr:hypothetical protein [Rhodopila sp.]
MLDLASIMFRSVTMLFNILQALKLDWEAPWFAPAVRPAAAATKSARRSRS